MKKNPSNRKRPDPDDRRRRQKKPRPSREVQHHEAQEKNWLRWERERTGRGLGRYILDTLEEDIKNVQQPPPGVKHDSRLYPRLYPYPRPNPRNSGLAGMLNLFRYKP